MNFKRVLIDFVQEQNFWSFNFFFWNGPNFDWYYVCIVELVVITKRNVAKKNFYFWSMKNVVILDNHVI